MQLALVAPVSRPALSRGSLNLESTQRHPPESEVTATTSKGET